MAEAAVLQKIKKDLLFCYICSAELKDLIGLPCLHEFCFECLETWHQGSQDKTQVICPACKKTSPVPKEGIRGFPGHFLAQNLQETMDKQSIEPAKCLVCGEEAEVHCVDCNKSVCQQCLTSHNVFMKDHQIVTIEELHSGQVQTEGGLCKEQFKEPCKDDACQVCGKKAEYHCLSCSNKHLCQQCLTNHNESTKDHHIVTHSSTQVKSLQMYRVCVHGEQVRYYCETEDRQVCIDCVSFKTCPIEHERMTLKEEKKKMITCPVCGKEAEFHCVDCNKDLCQACHTNHNEFIKDHHIVTIKELQSDQVTTEGRVCEVHGEQVRYYCETEAKQVCIDCVSLKTCPVEHERMTLKEAAKKQVDMIDGLKKKCDDNKEKFEEAIKDTVVVLDTLNISVKCANTEVLKCKEQYIEEVTQVFDMKVANIQHIYKDRVKDIDDKKKVLMSEVAKMIEVEKQASDFIGLNSDFLVTYNYSSLSNKLNELSLVKPVTIESLGYLEYESIPKMAPPTGYLLQRKRWIPIEQIPLSGMKQPLGIALNHDGEIAVTSLKGVKVFSRNGQAKCSFMDNTTIITDVTVSHDNRFIVASRGNRSGLQFRTKDGKYLSSVPLTKLNSVAIDANDRIIVASSNNTVSIHYNDVSLISKFTSTNSPLRLAATSEGEIVCSYRDVPSLQITDYASSNVRVLQPPPEVKKWVPGYVCSKQGEIFVANQSSGDPVGIYRYTSKGHYLGCVTTELKSPAGIALSEDGMELFVVEFLDCEVKIFHRE